MMIERLTPADLELVYREFRNHASFCKSSLIVETETKKLVPMDLSPGQIKLDEAIRRQRLKGVPVRIIYLKSRRIQATTGTAAHFFQQTAFQAGVHTAVIAHDETSTQNIFNIYRRFHALYKPFAGILGLPPSQSLSDRIYYEYAGDPRSSFIQVKTAGSTEFGRSFRLTNVHFSEFPYYERPLETLAAVMSALPKASDTSAVIEGTAKNIGDAFHRLWQQASDPSSGSEWLPLFMGWWEHPGNKMRPAVAPDRFMNDLTREERDLMGRFNLDLEQLAWRRWTIVNDCLGDVARFRKEHPSEAAEAFTASSRNRLSVPHIQRAAIEKEPLTGELQTEMVGTEPRLVFLPSEFGALRIWRRPQKGVNYAIGIDSSQGIDIGEGGSSDPDYCVAQVLQRDTGEQTAVLRARLQPGEGGRYCAALGRYFNQAQVCAERNPGGGGISLIEAMINADYPAGLLYHRSVTADQDPQVRGTRLGWDTTGVSRPMLIGYLDEAIRQDAIVIHDPITQAELLSFVIKPNGKAEAETGVHDDTVIALALALIVIMKMVAPKPQTPMPRPEIRRYGVPAGDPPRGQVMRVR
jgi:hypothetical protein